MSESRQEREQRLTREYQAYVDSSKSGGVEPINFMNWSFNAKVIEKGYDDDQKWLHATLGHAAPEEIKKAGVRRVERAAKEAAEAAAAEAARLESLGKKPK